MAINVSLKAISMSHLLLLVLSPQLRWIPALYTRIHKFLRRTRLRVCALQECTLSRSSPGTLALRWGEEGERWLGQGGRNANDCAYIREAGRRILLAFGSSPFSEPRRQIRTWRLYCRPSFSLPEDPERERATNERNLCVYNLRGRREILRGHYHDIHTSAAAARLRRTGDETARQHAPSEFLRRTHWPPAPSIELSSGGVFATRDLRSPSILRRWRQTMDRDSWRQGVKVFLFSLRDFSIKLPRICIYFL